MKKITNKPMSCFMCWLTGGHDLIRTEGNRDNPMRHLTTTSERCTKCTHRKVEKI